MDPEKKAKAEEAQQQWLQDHRLRRCNDKRRTRARMLVCFACRRVRRQIAAEKVYWKDQLADFAISVAHQEALGLMTEEDVCSG